MLRSVAGRYIVVAIGQASIDFNGLITLNDSGAYIWKKLADGIEYDTLIADMLADYDADEATIRSGVDAFLKTARDAGVLEES